jgi:methylated-DNA-[protein]-cysteine S-methyltransferase
MDLAISSPLGPLVIRAQGDAIVALDFAKKRPRTGRATPLLREAARQLTAYFAGKLRDFDLPLAPPGSEFQKDVWDLMREIPFGQTQSYGMLAKRLDTAPRAVGGACGSNPLPIIVPCHRVLGKDGALTGYSGACGLSTKRFLLEFEGALPA